MNRSGVVAIIGRPNVGKSTLLNRVLESELSIASPKAQTTRECLRGILTTHQGQMVLIDTPGIHHAKDKGLNAWMMKSVKTALQDPDVIWYMIDLDSRPDREKLVVDAIKDSKAPVAFILNKTDSLTLPQAQETLSRWLKDLNRQWTSFPVSALKGKGIKELLAFTWEKLPKGQPLYPDPDDLTDRPMRFIVAEKIREQLFLKLGDEIPYSCAVKIEEFKEDSKLPRIQATIVVERDSQKAILIGKGGSKIKEIGSAARAEIESFYGRKIFLGLKIETWKNWTRDPVAMKNLGFQ